MQRTTVPIQPKDKRAHISDRQSVVHVREQPHRRFRHTNNKATTPCPLARSLQAKGVAGLRRRRRIVIIRNDCMVVARIVITTNDCTAIRP